MAGGRVVTWSMHLLGAASPRMGSSESELLRVDAASEGSAETKTGLPSEPACLGRPDLCIPHLRSPAEGEYVKAMQAYESAATTVGQDNALYRPTPPVLPAVAFHSAQIHFVRVPGGVHGNAAAGYDLALWRAHSNVWRMFRLDPPNPKKSGEGHSGEAETHTPLNDGTSCGAANMREWWTHNASLAREPRLSWYWLLPSPVTCSAVCCEIYARCESAQRDYQHQEHNSSLVAIGTAHGGVFMCDGASGTTRTGLSQHRAAVTSLAFHRRR